MRIGKRIEGFWQRVTEGIAVQVLWSQFMAEARESYSLYFREIDWRRCARKGEAGDSGRPRVRFFGRC